jgi:hypothetical protein
VQVRLYTVVDAVRLSRDSGRSVPIEPGAILPDATTFPFEYTWTERLPDDP